MHMTSNFVVSIVEWPLRPRPSGEKVFHSDNSKASKKILEPRRGDLDVKTGKDVFQSRSTNQPDQGDLEA